MVAFCVGVVRGGREEEKEDKGRGEGMRKGRRGREREGRRGRKGEIGERKKESRREKEGEHKVNRVR